MNFNDVMQIIENDLANEKIGVAGEIFMREITYDDSGYTLSPIKILKKWNEIKSAPEQYRFFYEADMIRNEMTNDAISEEKAIKEIQLLGASHFGLPTEIEILEFLYDEDIPI